MSTYDLCLSKKLEIQFLVSNNINIIILLAQLTRSKGGGWGPAFSRDRSLALDEARQPMPDIQFSQSNRVIVYLPSESCVRSMSMPKKNLLWEPIKCGSINESF